MYGEMKIPRLNRGVFVHVRFHRCKGFVVRWPVGLIVTSIPKHSVCSERSLEHVAIEKL